MNDEQKTNKQWTNNEQQNNEQTNKQLTTNKNKQWTNNKWTNDEWKMNERQTNNERTWRVMETANSTKISSCPCCCPFYSLLFVLIVVPHPSRLRRVESHSSDTSWNPRLFAFSNYCRNEKSLATKFILWEYSNQNELWNE